MEIFHLVSLTVVIAITTMIHTHPNDTIVFREHPTSTIKIGRRHTLCKQFFVASGRIQAYSSLTIISKPYQAMCIHKELIYRQATFANLFRIGSIGKRQDFSRLSTDKDIITIREQACDTLIKKIPITHYS